MFRFLLSAVSIFVLISGMMLPQAVAARRCGERMPVTLLALYRSSESIYVGRYEKTEDGEATEDTADYTVIPIKKHFTISSALKGESQKLLTLEDTEYRYKNQEVAEEESEHGEEAEGENLEPGDSVLLFLKKNEDTGLIEPADFVDGIKKMTPDKLAAYEARIRELKGIFATEKPKYARLVDWMIRCAEDPLTRWEGTFELLQSFQNMDWQDERAAQAKEKPAVPESDQAEQDEAETPKEFDTGDPNFARSVSENQKMTLSSILANRELPKKSEDPDAEMSVTVGDRELIELVKRWGDSTVAASLVEQLRQNSSDANLNSELMGPIASMLHDDQLTGVSEEYSNIQWETDDAEVVAGEAQTPPPAESTESAEAPAEPAAIEQDNAAAETKDNPESKEQPAKKKTFGELRVELLAKFLSRADKVIEIEQSKADARGQ